MPPKTPGEKAKEAKEAKETPLDAQAIATQLGALEAALDRDRRDRDRQQQVWRATQEELQREARERQEELQKELHREGQASLADAIAAMTAAMLDRGQDRVSRNGDDQRSRDQRDPPGSFLADDDDEIVSTSGTRGPARIFSVDKLQPLPVPTHFHDFRIW